MRLENSDLECGYYFEFRIANCEFENNFTYVFHLLIRCLYTTDDTGIVTF